MRNGKVINDWTGPSRSDQTTESKAGVVRRRLARRLL